MDQSQAPVLDAIADFRRRGDVVYGPPAHKQGRGVDPRVLEVLGERAFASDILMLNGIDDRRMSGGILDQAEALMAEAVHADKAFFSTCGSSLSVKASMLAAAGPGEKLILVRNSHKSVVAGLLLSGIEPVWVQPRWDANLEVAHPPTAGDVAATVDAHPDAKGVLIVTPTDYGTCAELTETVAVCHERGVPVLVDEAWGCQFPFHHALPTWAMDAGADICVTSIHKSGSSFEQSSVFHLQGDRIDAEVLSARADLLSTTSPCALIYAGIDGWRRQMVEQGHDLIAGAIGRATRFAEAIVQIPGIDLDLDAWRDGDGVADLDPLKICFDVWRLGLTGYDAAAWLRNERHVNLGVADHRRMMAMFSHADDEATLGKVVNALRDLSDAHDVRNEPLRTVEIPPPGELETKTAMLPRDAFYAKAEQLSLDKAAGRICAELVTPYPPGIPALAPGELIDEAHISYLRTGIDHGMYVPDSADPELNTIRVVA